ncbi:MAG TPA: type II secretion system protein M [Rudaea sp.]|nr:type II secretion system protein M [Rudaea sp.]
MIAAWWNGLQPRERRMLAIGAIVAGLLLGWALLWYPLAHARDELGARVARENADLSWMRQAQSQAQTLHAQGTRSQGSRQGKSLLALADASARGAGLAGALKRVEPTGNDNVRVTFDVADFDALMNWLDALGRDYGVQVTDLSADKVEGLGLVNARVTLRDSGSGGQ